MRLRKWMRRADIDAGQYWSGNTALGRSSGSLGQRWLGRMSESQRLCAWADASRARPNNSRSDWVSSKPVHKVHKTKTAAS